MLPLILEWVSQSDSQTIMLATPSNVVLVTGGNGFLGQHIVKHLHLCSKVKEIRILDIKNHQKDLDYEDIKPVKFVSSDINDLSEEGMELFKGVDCVFHCAALVSYKFPADEKSLYKTNVEGTKNTIQQCLTNNVRYLIFTSGVEVCLKPYIKNSYFSVVINQSENKVEAPEDPTDLVFGAYGNTKLQAERIVLDANNSVLQNGTDKLKTISLRPTLLYGEGDNYLIPNINRLSNIKDGIIWSLMGTGGKHQMTYAGNAAWAHICAMETLMKGEQKVDGLAMFVTDNTPIHDITRTAQTFFHPNDINCNTSLNNDMLKPPRKNLCIPAFIAFIVAWIFDFVYSNTLGKISKKYTLPVSFKFCVIYSTSILFFSRLRANLSINYNPLFSPRESLENSSTFYKPLCITKKL